MYSINVVCTYVCVYVTIVKLLYYDYQGATIYKQGESVFIGHLLKGCDAEQSGEYDVSLCVCVCVCVCVRVCVCVCVLV